jgi:hypothetical protein
MSRSCAVSALLLFVANLILNTRGRLGKNLVGEPIGHLALWIEEGFRRQPFTDGGIAMVLEALLFAWLTASFVEGIRTTFAHHRYQKWATGECWPISS